MTQIAAGPELCRFRFANGQQVALTQQALELARHGGAGINEDDAGGQHLRQEWLEEGIMSATQDLSLIHI